MNQMTVSIISIKSSHSSVAYLSLPSRCSSLEKQVSMIYWKQGLTILQISKQRGSGWFLRCLLCTACYNVTETFMGEEDCIGKQKCTLCADRNCKIGQNKDRFRLILTNGCISPRTCCSIVFSLIKTNKSNKEF